MDLINDLFGDEIDYDLNLEKGKNKEYYIGKAEYILKELEDINIYFEFLKVFVKNYNKLPEENKQQIKEIMNIKKEIVIKDKIVTKTVIKHVKAKGNFKDDY
jgi:hypothetical protein